MAYVTYESDGHAQRAVEEMNLQEVRNVSRGEGLSVKLAKKKPPKGAGKRSFHS